MAKHRFKTEIIQIGRHYKISNTVRPLTIVMQLHSVGRLYCITLYHMSEYDDLHHLSLSNPSLVAWASLWSEGKGSEEFKLLFGSKNRTACSHFLTFLGSALLYVFISPLR